MPIYLYELANSRAVDQSVDTASVVRKWVATGSQDEDAIADSLLLLAPRRWRNLPRTKYGLEPLGGGNWMCTVDYSLSANTDDPETPDDPDDSTDLGPESSFDLSAGTAHITQGLGTQKRWRPGKTTDAAPDTGDALAYGTNAVITEFLFAPASTKLTLDGYFADAAHVNKKLCLSGPGFYMGQYQITAVAGVTVTVAGRVGPRVGLDGGTWVIDSGAIGTATDTNSAIGVTLDSVEGTEIVVPKFEFTWARQVFPVNLPYLRKLRGIVGKTNNAKWRGFERGELLYLGASGSAAPGNVWKVNHKFACGENLYAVRVTPSLIMPFKRAWDYLWCTYGYRATNEGRYQVPTAAYVEKVYHEADFQNIGLGR